jgi:hypothetical protein
MAGLLSAAEVEGMRATTLSALDTTAVVETQAFVSDGGGGGNVTWTAAGTFAARLSPIGRMRRGGAEGIQGERLNDESEVLFTLPAETEIDHNARIVCDGGTYSVTAISHRSQEMSRQVEAKVVE